MASAALGYGQGVSPEQTFDRVIAFEEHAPVVEDEALRAATANEARFDAILARLEADPEYRAFVQVNFTLTHEPYPQVATRERFAAFVERFPEVAGALTVEAFDDLVPLYEEHRFDLNFDLERARRQLRLNDAAFQRLCAFLRVLYATCIYELDRYFGQFMDRVEQAGFLDEAVVLVTSDHGESLYRDNALIHWTHGLELAPEVLGVPWIVRAPGRGLAPGRFQAVSRSIDVFPTLAGLCGVPFPENIVSGVDLTPALRGEAEPPRLLAFSHTTTWGVGLIKRFQNTHFVSTYLPEHDAELMWARIRDEDWVFKLRSIADGAERKWVVQAFDLAVDPEERVDRFDPQDPRHAALAAELERYKQRLAQGFLHRRPGLEGAEALERLKKIGYLR